jgi:hypothetical protein
MLDKNRDRTGPLGGSVEHSEGNDGESDMTILRFLYGSPRLCQLKTKELVHESKN